MTWTCETFERWLDDGRPDAGAAAAQGHARDCARCARALRAALELDTALAAPPRASAPAGFTDTVMHRVREARLARAAVRALPPAMAWWVRAAADPLVAMSLVLSGLVAWRFDALWAAAGWLAHRVALLGQITLRLPGEASVTFDAPAGLRSLADPTVLIGLMLALAPAALWMSWRLFRWSEHVVAVSFVRRTRTR